MRVSRRAVLLSALGAAACGGTATAAVLVDDGVLPGRSRLDRALGGCDAAPEPAASRGTASAPVTGTFTSRARGREVGYAVAYPPGATSGLPVCLALHGHGADANAALTCGDYAAVLAGAVRGGAAPFALAAVDGGNGYWHPHATDDPLGMLVDEFVPLLAGLGLDTRRLAVAGWSMGGYGALLAALTHRGLFRAVVATSPAIFRSYHDAHNVNPGAYDTPAEWNTYDVGSRAADLGGLPVRIAIGAADPFAPAVRALRDRLANKSAVEITTGCHDGRFWSSVAPAQVQAISRALAG